MALADVVHECQEPCAAQYSETTIQYLDDRIQALSAECVDELIKQGFRRLDRDPDLERMEVGKGEGVGQ